MVHHVGGARVAQHVGRQVAGETGPLPRPLHHHPGSLAREPAAPAVQEHRLGVVPPRPAFGFQLRPTGRTEPVHQGGHRVPAHRDDALLGPLAEGTQETSVEVEVGHGQAHQLRDAQPGAVQHLEDGPVSPGHGVGALHPAEQRGHIGLAEGLGQATGHPGHLHLGRGVDAALLLLGEEAVQAPHGHQRPLLGRRGPPRAPQVGDVGGDVVLGHLAHGGSPRGQPGHVGAQVLAVGREGVRRAAPLDPEPGEQVEDLDRQRRRLGHRVPARRSRASNRPMIVLESRMCPSATRATVSARATRSSVMYCSSTPCRAASPWVSPVAR